ncbi:MAG: tetratricopeptide repeat protein, partial [Phycisphaeraceae bacterium JB051]
GISQRSDGDYGAALASFHTALEHDSQNQPAHYQLALTYCAIAETHREQGDLSKAKAAYETALHHDSECEQAHEGLAQLPTD